MAPLYAIFKGESGAGATIISVPLGGIIVAYISGKFSPKQKGKDQLE